MAIKYKNFIFLATPRTASNSLFFAIRELGGNDIGSHHNIPCKSEYKDCKFVFSIRNHFDWLVSSWIKSTWRAKDETLQTITFNDWVTDILTNKDSQYTKFTSHGYVRVGYNQKRLYLPIKRKADHILKYENIEEDLANLLNIYIKDLTFPTANQTPNKKNYKDYYT